MRLDIINPASLLPSQPTDAGTPFVPPSPILPQNVTPAFNLPEDGNKPEDKHQGGNGRRDTESVPVSEVEEDQLPESFKLVMSPDFSGVFSSFYVKELDKIYSITKKLRESNGVIPLKTFSSNYIKGAQVYYYRERDYVLTRMYHYSRPGSRFKGTM